MAMKRMHYAWFEWKCVKAHQKASNEQKMVQQRRKQLENVVFFCGIIKLDAKSIKGGGTFMQPTQSYSV